MANRTDRDDLHAPPLFKTYAGNPGLKALESMSAPANAQHLPCAVLFSVGTAGHAFVFNASDGTANVIKYPAVGIFGPYRMAPLTFEATGTTADAGDSITVF